MLRRKRILGILAVVILVPVIGIAWWLLAPFSPTPRWKRSFPSLPRMCSHRHGLGPSGAGHVGHRESGPVFQ